MTRISKHIIVTDPRGRILTRTVETLADDGRGGTHVVRATTAGRCTGCGHPLTAPEQLSGYCGWCSRGPLCAACAVRCGVCNRATCNRCRRGFVWGRVPIPACPPCYRRLNRRAAHDQVMAARQAAFAMALQRRRERLRELALRLSALRSGITASASPLRSPSRSPGRGSRR